VGEWACVGEWVFVDGWVSPLPGTLPLQVGPQSFHSPNMRSGPPLNLNPSLEIRSWPILFYLHKWGSLLPNTVSRPEHAILVPSTLAHCRGKPSWPGANFSLGGGRLWVGVHVWMGRRVLVGLQGSGWVRAFFEHENVCNGGGLVSMVAKQMSPSVSIFA